MAIEHIWEWYLELHAARGSGGFGPNPISYTEMAAWAQMTAYRPTPWEVEAIRALDRAHLDHLAESGKRPEKPAR